MPKLLIINITCNQGSTGKISEQVGVMMKGRGWDVYYAHGARRVNPSQLKTIPFSSVFGECLHALNSLLFDADGLGSAIATKRLVEQIREIKPDVIQIHNIHGYYLNLKILFEYLNKTDIPVVITLHDCWLFTGHCVHPTIADCEKWKTECRDCPLHCKYPKKSIVDKSRRNYHLKKELFFNCKNLFVVPVSFWLESRVKQSYLKDKNIQVIQNGVDLEVFKPSAKKHESGFNILGVSNVWHTDKGLLDIYKLREILSDEYEITLVGLREKQVKALPKGINGITSTANQQELAKLYSESNVLINPTYADTYPTINLEALSCGTPVITYRTGGSPESLTPETGVVVEVGNVEALACAIKEMHNNHLSSEKCRERALQYFDKDRCFLKYVELYQRLLSSPCKI